MKGQAFYYQQRDVDYFLVPGKFVGIFGRERIRISFDKGLIKKVTDEAHNRTKLYMNEDSDEYVDDFEIRDLNLESFNFYYERGHKSKCVMEAENIIMRAICDLDGDPEEYFYRMNEGERNGSLDGLEEDEGDDIWE